MAVHLLRHPLTRLYPAFLKHRWSMGIFCILTLYLNFVAPFLLLAEYAVACISFGLTSLVVFSWGREFVDWVVVDLRSHQTDLRGLFRHSHVCVVTTRHIHDGSAAERLLSARQSALHYVKSHQDPDGSWFDFLAPAESTDWVTAYIGLSLHEASTEDDGWGRRARSFLLRNQQSSGGWGFRPDVPADADSTAYALAFLLRSSNEKNGVLERAKDFLTRHQEADSGGFRTYAERSEIARFLRTDDVSSFGGWCSAHPCVTAIVCRALLRYGLSSSSDVLRRALTFLRAVQSTDGYWEAYWWNGRLYSTVNCMLTLKEAGDPPDQKRIAKALEWLCASQSPDGGWRDGTLPTSSPFPTAWGLRGLLLAPGGADVVAKEKACGWLLDSQAENGSWVSEPILRIPEPSSREPWLQQVWKTGRHQMGTIIADQNHLFTTSTVLVALSECADSSSRIEPTISAISR